MEFRAALAQRRMVRNFRSDPIDPEVLQRVTSVVRRAPSAGFAQGHRLVVVTDPALRAAISGPVEPWYREQGFHPWLSQAPCLIVIGVSEAAYHDRYREADKLLEDGSEIDWPVPFWWFDAGGLLVLLQLAAIDAGLASGFASVEHDADLRGLLALPGEVAVADIMALGYAADDPAVPVDRLRARRRPDDDLVRWQRWGEA